MTPNFIKMSNIYRIFAQGDNLDFSKKALKEMYLYETKGKGNLKLNIFNQTDGKYNGYIIGKHWLNVMVSIWKKDIENRLLTKEEIYNDKLFPRWWLDKILKNVIVKEG